MRIYNDNRILRLKTLSRYTGYWVKTLNFFLLRQFSTFFPSVLTKDLKKKPYNLLSLKKGELFLKENF